MLVIRDIYISSPFLNKVFISEYFKQTGKIYDDDDDLLCMWVRGELRKGELIFNSLVGIL
jgi:hypothetical protein